MRRQYINLKIWLIPAVGLVIALVSLFFLPAQIPVHWGSSGVTMGSRYTILLLPGISMAVLLLGQIVPFFDPKSEAYNHFGREYNIIHLAVVLVLFCTELYTIAVSLGVKLDSGLFFGLLVGAMIIGVGNYLPKIPQNYLTGIKTIWGYSNERIWLKTHRAASRVWFGAGLLMMAGGFFREPYRAWIALCAVAVMLLVPRIYGMILYQREK